LLGFVGAASGLLGRDDFDEAGGAGEPECSATILLYENAWAAPALSSESDTIAKLKQLGELEEAGVPTEAEFEREKSRILGR
jgi:hypothetical protein